MEQTTEQLLRAMLNMTAAHRQHESFYAVSPREQAVVLQRHSRTLSALGDRWMEVEPTPRQAFSPYEGADDLNAAVATQLDGVLFMEGEGEPGEITGLKRELRSIAEASAAAAEWLSAAMQSAWTFVPQLFDVEALADMLGERHRIIANDWQGASLMSLIGHILNRAAELLDHIDFTPEGLRNDLASGRTSVGHIYSSAELIDHAAELLSDFAGLVHDNERRWRVFRASVVRALDQAASADEASPP